jgi:hypothetical protein
MKQKTQYILIILTLMSTFIYGQTATVEIQNMTYLNGGSISNCGTIDFEDNASITVQFGIQLEKPSSLVIGTANLKVLTKTTSSNSPNTEDSQSVQESFWTTGDPQFYNASKSITLYANDFNTSGGEFYVEFAGYESCKYSIVKDEVPSFSLVPTNTTVSCESTSVKNFTITPSNIPSGANVSYQWSVGSGWEDTNGNPISNFTTTSTFVQLRPYQYPPDNVSVTPILNSVSYPQLTSTVSLGTFNPFINIVGDDYVCSSGIYSLDNISSFNNVTVQSVSSSNTSIATASYNSTNGEITVNKVSDGIITLSVILQNSCNQTRTKTKELQIGIPASVFNATITGSDDVCQGQNYTYTLSGANHPCVNSIVWSVSSNLNIVSQSANTITVSKNPFDNQYAGEITATIPGSTVNVKKGVWVGTPSNGGLAIQKIGAYDFYVGRWTQLKANYTPLTYESNSPLDVTFDWQIPNSMVRSYTDTAFKDIKPNSSGQLTIGVRAVCDCGNGEWRYRTFEVDGDTGGGGGELTPID